MHEIVPHKDAPLMTETRSYWTRLFRELPFRRKRRSSGLGYLHMKFDGIEAIGHTGTNAGWEAALVLRPSTGDGLVLLSNSSNGKQARERFPIVGGICGVLAGRHWSGKKTLGSTR